MPGQFLGCSVIRKPNVVEVDSQTPCQARRQILSRTESRCATYRRGQRHNDPVVHRIYETNDVTERILYERHIEVQGIDQILDVMQLIQYLLRSDFEEVDEILTQAGGCGDGDCREVRHV